MCIIEIIILIDPLHLVPGADEVTRYLAITFEKPKRILVTKGSCWCVPRTSILRIRHQRN